MLTPRQTQDLQTGYALQAQGRPGDALVLLAPLARQFPHHADVRYVHALALKELGRAAEARREMEAALALQPRHAGMLNGYADVLAGLGEIDGALTAYDSVIALEPAAAQGWLNKGLTAHTAGRLELAEEVLRGGLERLPGDARLLAALAIVQKSAGRLDLALASFARSLASDGGRALTHHNYGVALAAAGRHAEAAEAYRRANALGLRTPELAANWAAAQLEQGDVATARALYHQAVLGAPLDLDHHQALTRIEWEYQGRDDAFSHLADAVRRHPHEPALRRLLVGTLTRYGRFAEADDAALAAQAAVGDDPVVAHSHAIALSELGQDGAGGRFEALVAARPDAAEHRIAFARHLLRIGQPDRAAAEAERATALAPDDQASWAYLGAAWAVLGDAREAWLLDYERFVQPLTLRSPRAAEPLERFVARVRPVLLAQHHARRHPGDQSLRHGSQTPGNLFERADPVIGEVQEALREAIGRYIVALPDDPLHPFLRRKTADFAFNGAWSVRLFASGFHISHVHPRGWISSASYWGLPAAVADPSRAGWIAFGAPPAELCLNIAPRRMIRPELGMLVLFPSFMWHGTVPFDDATPRLSIAFDVVPR